MGRKKGIDKKLIERRNRLILAAVQETPRPTMSELQKLFGLSRQQIHTILKSAGLTYQETELTDVQDLVKKLRDAGWTMTSIAAAVGIARQNLHALATGNAKATRENKSKLENLLETEKIG